MKLQTLVFFLLVSFVARPSDSLNVKTNRGLVFAQFGGVPSIFMLGYGHQFNTHQKTNWGLLGGVGVDFFRFQPYYNIETELKARLAHNFNHKHALVFELGAQYIFNPWYMSDPDRYFFECWRQRCPKDLFNFFANVGHQRTFENGLAIIAQLYFNVYDGSLMQYPLPGFEINYTFGRN